MYIFAIVTGVFFYKKGEKYIRAVKNKSVK